MAKDRNRDPSRVNILGVGIHALNMPSALNLIEEAILSGTKGYVCVTGVHGIMEAQENPEFKRIQNQSFLTTPDGMPTVWIGRLVGHRSMRRVYGPELMLEVCRLSANKGYSHFFYGGNPGVAEKLRDTLTRRFPRLKVVGTYTPPFRPLNPTEESELVARVAQLKPDCLWVGLSTPKQEKFMAQYLDKLDVKLMFGVGAAFDIHTGRVQDSPQWIKKSGLQWLHRLIQEPKRLWKRYLINNPRFLWRIAGQIFGIKRYEL